ncbi:sugar phosphate nucleotidyltransferase [Actinoallomurus sp. NPDC052274]|uniref:sugar phosphate nucleotidyltransferase n=1 Tax=Actinoallomurus sp. NPDC052274 TaxID=3155420 RepID=UPI003412545E
MALKAVITVAGYGSRFFPIAKAVNKCMLPILDRPVVHLAVQDCVAAGIEQIAIVTAPGDTQVRHYFTEDRALRDHFHERGWDGKYEPIARLHELAEFTFLEQPRDGRYGTALPAMVAAEWIGGDDFLLMSGDDVILRADGGSDLADMVRARTAAGTPGAIAAATVPGEQAHRYGVFVTRDAGGRLLLDRLEEKPADYIGDVAHVNISRAVLPNAFLDFLDGLKPAVNGEYQSTDAIAELCEDLEVLVHPIRGTYHDCGDPAGWLAANNAAAAI